MEFPKNISSWWFMRILLKSNKTYLIFYIFFSMGYHILIWKYILPSGFFMKFLFKVNKRVVSCWSGIFIAATNVFRLDLMPMCTHSRLFTYTSRAHKLNQTRSCLFTCRRYITRPGSKKTLSFIACPKSCTHLFQQSSRLDVSKSLHINTFTMPKLLQI